MLFGHPYSCDLVLSKVLQLLSFRLLQQSCTPGWCHQQQLCTMLQPPQIHFRDLPPASPRLSEVLSTSKSEFTQKHLCRYRDLSQRHSLLYVTFDHTISCLYERHEVCTQRVACIMSKVMGCNGSAQQAIASFSSCRLMESGRDVAGRKMVSDRLWCGSHVRVYSQLPSHKDPPLVLAGSPLADLRSRCLTGLYWTHRHCGRGCSPPPQLPQLCVE